MAFKHFTDTHGILHRFTCPYTSEQNGISERKHRHITETALPLLAQSHLASNYWVDAFLTAVYLINRLPTPVLQNQSPYFKLLHKHPDYSLLKTFGCACYPLLRPYIPHKLSLRSTKCVFLGYSSTQKGYRCLDLKTNSVYTSRHVIFDELQFPASEDPASKPPVVDTPSGVALSIPPSIISSPSPIFSKSPSDFVAPSMSPTPVLEPAFSTSPSSPPPNISPSPFTENTSPSSSAEMSTSHEGHPHSLTEQVPSISIPSSAHPSS